MADFKRAGIGCPYCGNDLYVDFDICPHCGKEVPASLLQLIHRNETTVTKTLQHFPDLEEDSKTKIGTFERLHEEYLSKPKKLGFDDTDYAPLVSLLCSVLELELSYAVYDKFIAFWQLLAQKDSSLILPDNRDLCNLGTIKLLLEKAEKNEMNMPQSIRKDWGFAKDKFLDPLKERIKDFRLYRNKAAHKDAVSLKEFNDFYDKYQPFYTRYMPSILELKKRGDSHGYRLFVELRKHFPSF